MDSQNYPLINYSPSCAQEKRSAEISVLGKIRLLFISNIKIYSLRIKKNG
jgi:hypothetical protein